MRAEETRSPEDVSVVVILVIVMYVSIAVGNMGKAPTKFNSNDIVEDSLAEMRDANTRRLEREIELELDDE